MLLPLDGRNIAYDLVGPETAPVVCMTHSLASDGGMWTEQVPRCCSPGFRVLRIDMRGHGGSGPVAGDYTMSALASDVAAVLDALAIAARAFHRTVDRRDAGAGLRAGARRQAGIGDVVRHAARPRRPVRRRSGSSASIRCAARIR